MFERNVSHIERLVSRQNEWRRGYQEIHFSFDGAERHSVAEPAIAHSKDE